MKNLEETILEKFDEEFGKAGPEMDSDSIGRSAGCDDCSKNIMLREEHRAYLSSAMREVREDERKKVVEEIKAIKIPFDTPMEYPKLTFREQIITTLLPSNNKQDE